MEENPFRWVEIYVQDMERAKAFYAALFDYEFTYLDTADAEMWAFPADMDKGGATGSLIKMEGVPSGGGGTLVYFGTDDCSVQASRAAEAGGRVFKPKMSIGQHGFISLVVDTEGNMIGLHSMK
jgi:predicted enzyme related to lactoylglutathione lyase